MVNSHLIPFLLFISALQCITLKVYMASWMPPINYAGDWRFDCRYSKGRPIYRKVSAKTYMFNREGWVWFVGGIPKLNNGWLTMFSRQYVPYLEHSYHQFYNTTSNRWQSISPLHFNVTCAERSLF